MKKDIIIIDNTITIGDERFEPRYVETEPKRYRSSFMRVLAATTLLSGGIGIGSGYSRRRPNVDIVKEFELIQRKESKLSRNDRDWIVYQFNRLYKKIES